MVFSLVKGSAPPPFPAGLREENLKRFWEANFFRSCTGRACMKRGQGFQPTSKQANRLTSESSSTHKSCVTVAQIWSVHTSSDLLTQDLQRDDNTHTLQGWYLAGFVSYTKFIRFNRRELKLLKRTHMHIHRPQNYIQPLRMGEQLNLNFNYDYGFQ